MNFDDDDDDEEEEPENNNFKSQEKEKPLSILSSTLKKTSLSGLTELKPAQNQSSNLSKLMSNSNYKQNDDKNLKNVTHQGSLNYSQKNTISNDVSIGQNPIINKTGIKNFEAKNSNSATLKGNNFLYVNSDEIEDLSKKYDQKFESNNNNELFSRFSAENKIKSNSAALKPENKQDEQKNKTNEF